MIFLDTDIISYYFNSNKNVLDNLLEAIDNNKDVCTTVINVYEIQKGFKWKHNHLKLDRFNDFLNDITVHTIDDEVINIASDTYAKLRKAGKTIGDADILIASIVMKNKGVLITNNIKHYENIELLKIENWV